MRVRAPMADDDLRERERHWMRFESVRDEASYLAQRLRSGTITRSRLDIAAYCGSEAALAALGKTLAEFAPFLADPGTDSHLLGIDLGQTADELALESFVRGLSNWGAEPVVKAAFVAADVQLEHCPNVPGSAVAAYRLASALRESPEAAALRSRAERAVRVAERELDRLRGPDVDAPGAQKILWRFGAPLFAVQSLLTALAEPDESDSGWKGRVSTWPAQAAASAAHWTSAIATQKEIARRLSSWALSSP